MKEDIFVRTAEKMPNHPNMKKTLVLFLFFFASHFTFAQNYKYHSLFIFSFTRYVQWPESSNQGDFEITVLGDSPLVNELTTMAQTKKVGDRPIKVNKIQSIGELKKCNILFVPSGRSAQLAEVIAKVNSQPILVVTEENGLGVKGSNINFIMREGKLAFELNQATLNKQNLKVSNELSRLAILI
jgi:hypothetical protein